MNIYYITDFGFVKAISTFISGVSFLIQIGTVLITYIIIKDKFQKFKKFLAIVTIILSLIEALAFFSGRYSERVIADFKGMVYFGQIENGQANGWGRLFDENRNIKYIGEFKNNIYEGDGCLYCYEGEKDNYRISSKREGKYQNGKLNGYGKIYIYPLDEALLQYDGELRDDKYNGKGKRIDYNSLGTKIGYYDGCWADNEKFGFGVYEWSEYGYDSPKKYIGTFVSGKFNGEGIEYLGDEMIYDGQWSNGRYHGKGTLYYMDENGLKRVYEGDFIKGKKDGYGIVYDENNIPLQEGQFEKDEFKGFG